ncbi:MAG: sigma-70 family RNA polymerase sigma factor [Candidatus Poribacteria bacterium]|nr:sigma-70 family RNA polymerase sigma factor [Candidatus Poribacteria bacterium]MDE0503846.1 sigma-70 family RNA polymerase sigma factor [Candidatus Poribacteria bacterium]
MDTILEDELLVAQFQAGRRYAFDELMKRYKHKIYAYLLRSVRNCEDAEELTIEVFFKAYRALDGWQPQARFSTWIYKIAHNLSIDHHRAKSRRVTFSLDDDELAIEEPVASDLGSDPAWQLEEKDRNSVIRAAVDQLSPNQKAVFMLNRYEGLQINEITDVLGIAEGTVKVHLHRAMKKLQILLKPYWEGNEI